MNPEILKFDGALLAARYAFMPNKLRYCGGDNNSELFSYAANNSSDQGLKDLLAEFETMYPYLRLIAEANKIADPFNYRVVEAYWIGNELLENVSMNNFYRYMIDEQKLKKKFKPALLEKVFGKIPAGAKPHHSFHVLNIPKRTGNYPVEHTINTMDQCRISWGRIQENKKTKEPENNLTNILTVEYQPLEMINNNIVLGTEIKKQTFSEINSKAFVSELKTGDWVSIHWGWVCDKLTDSQALNLKKWTEHNLLLANLK